MENNITLKAKDLYLSAFKKTKENFFKFLAVGFCFVVLSFIDPSGEKGASMVFLRSLVSFVGSIYLSISMYRAILDITNDKTVSFSEFFIWPKNGFKMLFTDILAKLAIAPFIIGVIVLAIALGVGGSAAIGLVFAILGLIISIPVAIFLSVRLSLAKYFALDTGSGVIDSIKNSYKVTKGYFWKLIALNLFGLLVMVLGLLALVIGLFWAIPTVIIAQVMIYKAFSRTNEPSLVPEIQPLELSANMPESPVGGVAQN